MTRIVNLKADNFKRLRAVDITPTDDLVVISGRNGQGKTSVLDAITAALGGTNTKNLPKPIRDGAGAAEIIIETPEYTITRRFTPSGSTLTVTGRDGLKVPKGQAKLDALLGRLSLDPLAFTQLDDRKQRETLLELVDLPFDPAALDQERAEIFEQRTELNRELKRLTAQADAYDVPADAYDLEELSAADLIAQIRAAEEQGRQYTRDRVAADEARAEVGRLQQALNEAMTRYEAAAAVMREWQAQPIGDLPMNQLSDMNAKLDNIEQHNAQARQAKALKVIVEQQADLAEDVAQLTAQIDEIDRAKADGLKKAKFPGGLPLGFDDSGVLLNGIPFKQASGAEQLRASLAMAIALNPELRVIRIADGSLLDSEGLRLVADMAAANDCQVWIEVVSDGDGFGFMIEDGEVVDPEAF